MQQVHAARLEYYCDTRLHINEALREHVKYNNTEYEVKKLTDVRFDDERGRWGACMK
jgi:hypothetical protein